MTPRKFVPWLTVFTLLLSLASIIATRSSTRAQTTPQPAYPASSTFTSVKFDFSTLKNTAPGNNRSAPGSDNWVITWADDGHQYTSWGDGGGFGGTNNDGRVSFGIGRVEGSKDTYSGYNVWGGKNPESSETTFGGKAYGIISLEGTLYMWVCGTASDNSAYQTQRLYRSDNHAQNWTGPLVEFTPSSFADNQGFFCPTFLQSGQDYSLAADGYVYTYAPEVKDTNWNVQKPGEITLMRVEKTNIEDINAYQYFAGLDPSGNPQWSTSVDARQPVFSDADNGVMRTSVIYHPPTGRYILTTQQVDRFQSDGGYIGIYEAPNQWGPWSTVLFENAWQVNDVNGYALNNSTGALQTGSKTVYWNFSPKWWQGENGFVMVGTFDGADEWGTIEGELITAQPTPLPGEPYPRSTHITSVAYDTSSHISQAPGSDNWPVTWADDGHQYTSWGDGGGFGGTNNDGRVSLGFARIEGSSENFQGYNVWGGKNPENPAQFDGKSYGIISINGTLYAWWGRGSNTSTYADTQLIKSTDHAATWTKPTWDLVDDVDSSLIMPTILNFGQDYSGARDAYVYHYFIRKQGSPTSLDVHIPGYIDLARTPVTAMPGLKLTDFEYFAGLDASGQPVWTSNATDRQAVFHDPQGVGWNVSVSYNSGLGKYLLMTEHTQSFQGNMGMFEAAEPWGPWYVIEYSSNWQGFGSTFYWNFANKWLSQDGTSFSLLFTGTGSNDSFNLIRGSFASGTTGPSPTPANTPTPSLTPSPSPTSFPLPDTDSDMDVDYVDVSNIIANFLSTTGTTDVDGNGITDIYDYNRLIAYRTTPAGPLAEDLLVNDGQTWLVRSDLQPGTVQYTDRSFTLDAIPDQIHGADWIQTANESKSSTTDPLATFNLPQTATVYIAVDDRVGILSWMSQEGFTDTGLDLVNSEPQTFSLYAKSYPQGPVYLSPQNNSRSMYTVVVQ